VRFNTLPEWLHWQETLHFTEVDPGLDRIGRVWHTLGRTTRLPFTVITVAGTNGKGSSVAMLESILRHAGYKTGTYTSPHILRYNERICVNGEPVEDDIICQAFSALDIARESISLTYFEFATLAAATIFEQQQIDIAILEVGMGGRLDAVNLFDTDIALITPISLDHTQWLGDNREKIGFEKAGIITAGNPVVCSECPPKSVIKHAAALNSQLYQSVADFSYQTFDNDWQWNNESQVMTLPYPALEGSYQLQNAAAVLQVIALLKPLNYIVSEQHIQQGLRNVKLSGRFQRIKGDVEVILDVTHNQQGATNLAALLLEIPNAGQTFAVIGMLKDKDAAQVGHTLSHVIDKWFVAGLEGERGMRSDQLTAQLNQSIDSGKISEFETVEQAYLQAINDAVKGDRILVFGSFHTVEAVMNRYNLG
jgi:dihydrofolate synthase/folylpolyglutamate synthase